MDAVHVFELVIAMLFAVIALHYLAHRLNLPARPSPIRRDADASPRPAAQAFTLVVPRVQIQCVAVAEHDGDVVRPRGVVDLDVQRGPVLGDDLVNVATQGAEPVRAPRRHRLRSAAQQRPLGDRPEGGSGGQRPGGEQPAPGHASGGGDVGAHELTSGSSGARPVYSRGTRAPMRVTTS